jgi:uncharacterized membrane protein (UPF0182 family)
MPSAGDAPAAPAAPAAQPTTPRPATAAADAPATATNPATARLIREAGEAYDRARAAQRNEDWATYGAEMRKLGDILRRLKTP